MHVFQSISRLFTSCILESRIWMLRRVVPLLPHPLSFLCLIIPPHSPLSRLLWFHHISSSSHSCRRWRFPSTLYQTVWEPQITHTHTHTVCVNTQYCFSWHFENRLFIKRIPCEGSQSEASTEVMSRVFNRPYFFPSSQYPDIASVTPRCLGNAS